MKKIYQKLEKDFESEFKIELKCKKIDKNY